MNQKEVREIKKRLNPEKDSISRIYGCYVNAAGEIVTTLDMSVGLMEQEEAELYFKLLKKTLSGTLGKNLLDIAFSIAQVENSDEHRLLQGLRSSHLRDAGLRDALYQRIIESLDFGEDSYVILLASDSYDVPFKGSDDEIFEEGSGEVFDYILCCICPVKDAKSALRYIADEHNFRGASTGHVLSAPELGFLFPAFDDRAANIYNALYYSRRPDELHQEFIDGVFHTEPPMSAGEQKAAFETALCQGLEDQCSMEVLQAIHERIHDQLQEHKERKDPEPPTLTPADVGMILADQGVERERIAAFQERCGEEFGENAVLNPENLIDPGKFQVKTEQITVSVDPEFSYRVETCMIDGKKYIMIPVGKGVEVNGLAVNVSAVQTEELS